MGRAPCCDKANVKRGPWSPEEDATLKSFVEKNGTGGNWIALPQKAGLKRCGKSCRLRWLNYLRPDIKHGNFTEEEDNIICSLYKAIGSRWSVIASHLPGRTDNDVKNHWNTKLKKKLFPSQLPDQSNNRTKTQIPTFPSTSPPPTTTVTPETLNYFHGYSTALVPLEGTPYQLPEIRENSGWNVLTPSAEDMSAASSSSKTVENANMAASSSSDALFDLDGPDGWMGKGDQDLIFGGNLWGGEQEGNGEGHDPYQSVSFYS